MTFNLKHWQNRNNLTCDNAAKSLGMGRRTYFDYLRKETLPKWLVLACKAIEAGIEC